MRLDTVVDIYNEQNSNYSVIPRNSDVVVEVGVNRGKDTAGFAKLSNNVIGFEPSPRNFEDGKENLRRFQNISLINEGVWNKSDQLELKYGNSRGDDGFLEPDKGRTGEIIENVPVDTIENHLNNLGVENIDFLKIEAEGAEPEIIECIGRFRPRNIVVNAGMERDRKPTGIEVMKLLQPLGYTLVGVKQGFVLFFQIDAARGGAFHEEFR